MILAVVTGTIVSTINHPSYDGEKLLLVERCDEHLNPSGKSLIAVDRAQAGPGDLVLIVDEGNGARQVLEAATAPVRTVIVGVVDQVDVSSAQR